MLFKEDNMTALPCVGGWGRVVAATDTGLARTRRMIVKDTIFFKSHAKNKFGTFEHKSICQTEPMSNVKHRSQYDINYRRRYHNPRVHATKRSVSKAWMFWYNLEQYQTDPVRPNRIDRHKTKPSHLTLIVLCRLANLDYMSMFFISILEQPSSPRT